MQNAQVVRDSIEVIWNRCDLSRIDDFYTEEFVCHGAGTFLWDWQPGRPGIERIVTEIRTAFPDYRESPEIVIEQGEMVSVRQVVTGTNTGPGIFPPTSRPFRVVDTMICRIEDGKLAEQWGLFDQYSLFIQLGLIEPVGPGS